MNQPASGGQYPPWRLSLFDTLPSTADFCCAQARAGEPAGLAAMAHHQTQARGRAGRPWTSPAGNLPLSLLFRPGGPARVAGLWSMLAGVALADMLSPHIPQPGRLALKWPNDVLLDGRKLAGILVESATTGAGDIDWMVVSFGVNLAVAPDLPDRPTACLAECGPAPSPESAAWALLAQLDHWRAVFDMEGFPPIRAAWLTRAQSIGTPMTIKLPTRHWSGHFAGLGEDGSLALHTEGALRHFPAGEIVQPGSVPS